MRYNRRVISKKEAILLQKFLHLVKKDPVLTAAWLLALLSAFFVPPDRRYADYIDWRSLGILWSLMVVMQGLRACGVFDRIGARLLSRAERVRTLVAVLIFLCFFSAMFITNDVALITFVPFAVLVLQNCGREDLLLMTVVLQTVAANLGSMLTPVGNPQNLYLYGLSGMSVGVFLRILFPYTLLSGGLLLLFVFGMKAGGKANAEVEKALPPMQKGRVALLFALFLLTLLAVMRVLPVLIPVLAVLAVALIWEREAFRRADYALLLTFIGFFIFTGNIARIPAVHDTLATLVGGHELVTGVLASQCISNVPAALLLAGFTENYEDLLLGVNFGGLGTLIASMASLISYKQFTAACAGQTKRYIGRFTLVNLLFLGVLLAARFLLA